MKVFSQSQVMLALCYMSYYGFTLDESDRQNAAKILLRFDAALSSWPPLKDQWKVVWGPAVFALPGTKFDDALMYVVQNLSDPSQYVIAIRGTNPISIPNWIIWDFQANELKAWPYGNPDPYNQPMLSLSTSFGLVILQGLRPEETLPGYKQTVLEFFQQETQVNNNLSICVTGHSLGGALAPVLALWLKDIQGTQLTKEAQVSSIAFAGPSPGNSDFAEYFNQRMEKDYLRIANSLDIVTYAWQTETLSKAFSAYLPLVPSIPLAILLKQLVKKSIDKDYLQIGTEPTILPGELKLLALPYLVQAIYQHVQGYVQLMDMQDDIPIEELLPFSAKLKEVLGHLIYL
ncbi:MAG: triacylglycerol lipase [Paraglaciecola sp.]|jgi:triacylglycerol lipase